MSSSPHRHFALVGDPIAQSPSPAMHNAALRACGIDATYELRPTTKSDAAAVVRELLAGSWAGLNVTTPLKTVLAPHARLMDAAAKAGAVNTLWCDQGGIVGALTDVEGVREPLAAVGVKGDEGLIIGAGGAARAAALALEGLGMIVHVAARRIEAAEIVLGLVAPERRGQAVALADPSALALVMRRVTAVVQTTPAGRAGSVSVPLPWQLAPAGVVAFEMLYRPRRTEFLTAAGAIGGRLIEGWEMLLAQGARSFELWTGLSAPRDVMKNALLAALTT